MHSLIKSPSARMGLLAALALPLSGCAVIEGIFKAGIWVGVIAVAIVLAVAFGLVRWFNG